MANLCFFRYAVHFLKTWILLHIPEITFESKSCFSFSKSTSFIIFFSFSYMHLVRISFQIALSDSVKFTRTNIENILSGWYYWIFDNLFLRSLFSCDLSDLCLDLNLNISLVLFNIFPDGQFSWRNSISKALLKELPNIFKAVF